MHDQNENEITSNCECKRYDIIHTDPKQVPPITSWAVEAALRDTKNWTTIGNDHINIETLKAGKDAISKTLAKGLTRFKKLPSRAKLQMAC